MVSTDIAEKKRFVVLDGMRGLAALVVITDHVPSGLLTSLLPGRYLAVDFFFVLSGFVLAHVYSQRLAGGMTTLDFMRVRLIRLYPLYLLAALVGAGWALLHALKGWFDATPLLVLTSTLFALFLVPAPPSLSIWQNAPYPLNGPSWSLFFELFINVVFALVARWLKPSLCLVFMAVGGVLLIPTVFWFGQLDGGFAWSNFVAGFPRVIFGFFAGVWLYQMRPRWRFPALPAWAAYVALLAVFAMPAQGIWRPIFDLAAALVIFPALVNFSADSAARGGLMRVSAALGALSYGIYILHVPVWGWLSLVLGRVGLALPGVANVGLAATAAIVAAAILHVAFDTPVRRFLSRTAKRVQRPG